MFHSNTEKLTKTFFHISLDLYLGHSIIIVSLDSDIKRLASSTAFIHWPLILTPSWNQAPPRGKKACKKNWRARRAELGTGEGEELRAFFPTFPTRKRSLVPGYSHFKGKVKEHVMLARRCAVILKMFPDLLHLKYLDSQANIRQ